jgi:hypothetical protein
MGWAVAVDDVVPVASGSAPVHDRASGQLAGVLGDGDSVLPFFIARDPESRIPAPQAVPAVSEWIEVAGDLTGSM